MNKIKMFWIMKRNIIKNTIMSVTIPVLIISLMGIHRMNKIVKENGLDELFYGDDEEKA